MYSIIVAMTSDGGIGNNGGLPWIMLPEDMSFFRRATSGVNDKQKTNIIIMGRKTWESLPTKPLKNRINIVVTSTSLETTDTLIAKTFEEALALAEELINDRKVENVFAIGGASIYGAAIEDSRFTTVFATVVHPSRQLTCDTFFDLKKLEKEFECVYTDGVRKSTNPDLHYEFVQYQRRKKVVSNSY